MKNRNSICIIICWYGPYPWYLPYFIHSCSFNLTIDFIIITDNKALITNKPPNVRIIKKTVDEIKKIAKEKLGFSVKIENPYKLNDFKPAYGFLFPEVIKDYDFWGHADLDIICGNIREFITDEMMSLYDFIGLRHDYTTGCFSMYRNSEKMNKLFMESKDYKKIFSNSKHYCFDECSFAWNDLRDGKSIFDIKTETQSLTYLVKSAELRGEIRAHFDFILMEGKTGRVVFDNGRVIYKQQFEAILYHLFWLKKVYAPEKIPKKVPGKYYISPTRIYHSRNPKALLIIKEK